MKTQKRIQRKEQILLIYFYIFLALIGDLTLLECLIFKSLCHTIVEMNKMAHKSIVTLMQKKKKILRHEFFGVQKCAYRLGHQVCGQSRAVYSLIASYDV